MSKMHFNLHLFCACKALYFSYVHGFYKDESMVLKLHGSYSDIPICMASKIIPSPTT